MATTSTDWRALYPFASHTLSLPAGEMHYVDEGPGAPLGTLLMVHGNPTWSFHWRELIARFSDRYRVVAVDHLGCGLSDKPQRAFHLEDHIAHLGVLVDRLGLERITLVAQDWGGAIGLGTMLRRKEHLERMVLFNTGAFPPWYIPRRIAMCRWPVVGRLAVQGGNAFALAALRMTLARKPRLDPAVAEGCLAPYDRWSHRRQIYEFVADIPTGVEHPTWRTLADIEQGLPELGGHPALLVWGMQDWCFRPDCLQKFTQVWPDAEVHRLEDVGHWVVEDAPEEVLELMEGFLATTRSRGAT